MRAFWSVGKGSSPLSRGILHEVINHADPGGIIPALAGNTDRFEFSQSLRADHPRSRGEYSAARPSFPCNYGSSPLSRGIHSSRLLRQNYRRIIPALAGNTSLCIMLHRLSTDHPRSRGEYLGQHVNNMNAGGSSPLSRGIRLGYLVVPNIRRIIPALAGNTNTCPSGRGACKDHPRSRGEYFCHFARSIHLPGSSPLSRGIRNWRIFGRKRMRIIPALAGNTSEVDCETLFQKDHPRSRGEYAAVVAGFLVLGGSSPLSRGIRLGWHSDAWPCGIIPALAGNTQNFT